MREQALFDIERIAVALERIADSLEAKPIPNVLCHPGEHTWFTDRGGTERCEHCDVLKEDA